MGVRRAVVSQGLDAAVVLSNNVFLADALRLHAVVEARALASSGNAAAAHTAMQVTC